MKGGANLMKTHKLMTLGLAVICSLAVASAVMAQEPAKKAEPAKKIEMKAAVKTEAKAPAKTVVKKAAIEKKHEFTGIVASVDAAANTLTVDKKGESMTFTAGKNIKLADIKKDSKVNVTYVKDGNKCEALKVVEAKAIKAPAKKAAK